MHFHEFCVNGIVKQVIFIWGFPSGTMVKNISANIGDEEIQLSSLGWEDHLEQEMATHFSIIAWKIPWTEELAELQSMGSQKVGYD